MWKAEKLKAYLASTVTASLLITGLGMAQTAEELQNPDPADWPTYGRNLEMWRYSPLDQISSENAGDLRITWSRSLGFTSDAQFSPTVYQGVMYINGADRVIALDAASGDLIWEYKVELDEKTGFLTASRSRGSVVIYEGKVFNDLGDGRVVAIDAKTGAELWSTQVGNIAFGEGFSAGPIFADGKLIAGPSGADVGGSPGRVVALDTESGELLWTFNTVPQPGEAGFETWDPPSAAEWGGGSAWVPGAYDPVTKTVIYGVGQPIPWYPENRDGDLLYTASWVALDVETGELKWYHQVVPGDEWDLDQIATPMITDLEVDGESKHVALLPTTTGFLVLIDLETGEFIKAHQFMPELTIHQGYEADGTPIIDDSYRYTEPGQTQLVCGFRWVDFEPAAFSPATGLYYRPNNYDCVNMANSPRPDDWQPGESPINVSIESLPDRFDRVGAVSAINPDTGEIAWEFSLGYSMRSGVSASAGNLVMAGFADRVFRIFDATTGDIVFQQVMPSYMGTNPITYAVEGKQYIAIAVGGTGGLVIYRQSDQPPLVNGEVTMFVFALP